MIHASNTTREKNHLELVSKEEADEVFEKWKPEFLDDSTKIRRALSTEKPNRAVIIKKVPRDVTDETIRRCLDTPFTNAKATHFKKRDSTKLGTGKIILRSENDLEKVLQQGLFIDSISYKTILIMQNGIYRLSDASNARTLVTSVPKVNQLRNVDTAVKIIFLGTAPTKIRKANVRTVI